VEDLGLRGRGRLVTFLDRTEIDALLAATDRERWVSRRDHALLLTAVRASARPISSVPPIRSKRRRRRVGAKPGSTPRSLPAGRPQTTSGPAVRARPCAFRSTSRWSWSRRGMAAWCCVS